MTDSQTTARTYLQTGNTCYRSAAVGLLFNILPNPEGELKQLFSKMKVVRFEVMTNTSPFATLLASGARAIPRTLIKRNFPNVDINATQHVTLQRVEYCPKLPLHFDNIYSLLMKTVTTSLSPGYFNTELVRNIETGQMPVLAFDDSINNVSTGGSQYFVFLTLLYYGSETFHSYNRTFVEPETLATLTQFGFQASPTFEQIMSERYNDNTSKFLLIYDLIPAGSNDAFFLQINDDKHSLTHNLVTYYTLDPRWELKGFMFGYSVTEAGNHAVCMYEHQGRWIIIDSNVEGDSTHTIDYILKNLTAITAVYICKDFDSLDPPIEYAKSPFSPLTNDPDATGPEFSPLTTDPDATGPGGHKEGEAYQGATMRPFRPLLNLQTWSRTSSSTLR